MPRSFPDARLSLICFAAAAVAFPIAIISIAKFLLVLCALAVIVKGWSSRSKAQAFLPNSVSPMILLSLAILASSALWSTGSSDEVLAALAKHGKLILIPIILYLTRSRREAFIALAFFMGAQIFLLASTWFLYFGVPIPWVTSKEAGICAICSFAIFSSYLDQSIMTAVLAAVCWHLRGYLSSRHRTLITSIISALALVCVFFIFQGRTGYLVAVALTTLAIMWELPSRFRFAVAVIPLALVLLLAASSGKVRHGVMEIAGSIQSFRQSGYVSPSSGTRLVLWRGALRSMADNPLMGTGVGSWDGEFRRQQAGNAPTDAGSSAASQHRNPHQEYLLWGTALGVPGIALLCAVLLALYRDSLQMDKPERRAMQSVLLALTLACLFNCALYDALIGDFFCIALALVAALRVGATPVATAAFHPRPGV